MTTGPAPRSLRADDVPLDLIGEVGRTVVERVSEKRSTWRNWNLAAEASRQMMGRRFATMADREQILTMVIEDARHVSIALPPSPPELPIGQGRLLAVFGLASHVRRLSRASSISPGSPPL